jgi:nucleoside-diphosphate-sugar epimerase
VVKRALVTGGSGFLGTEVTNRLLQSGWDVVVFDLNKPMQPDVQFIRGDIRDFVRCASAVQDIDVVFHNVAQVPLAKNKELFNSVNIDGAKTILDASANADVKKFIMTSSSAVFGLPMNLPANKFPELNPVEEYGKAKLAGERQITEFHKSKMDIAIVRPRTILSPGRLGLFSILFDWISKGLDVFIFGDGEAPYQFIHASDLAGGLENASNLTGFNVLNLGAMSYGTLRSDLEDLCAYAKTGSRVRSIPAGLARKPLLAASKAGLIPLATYQLLLYSQAMYFDSSDDWDSLSFQPSFSNRDCFRESYDWYRENLNRNSDSSELSVHQKPTTGLSLRLFEKFLRLI